MGEDSLFEKIKYYELRADQKFDALDFNGAIEDYTKIIDELDESYAHAYYQRAQIYGILGNTQAQKADISMALTLDPNNPEYKNYKKIVMKRIKKATNKRSSRKIVKLIMKEQKKKDL